MQNGCVVGANGLSRVVRGATQPRMLGRLLALAAAVVFCAGPAWARRPHHRWELFAEGGGSFWNDQHLRGTTVTGVPPRSVPTRMTTHIGGSGRLFAGFRFWMNRREAIEVSYSYATADITATETCEEVSCSVPFVSSPSVGRLNTFSVNYVRALRTRGRVRPFLTAGVGATYFYQAAANHIHEPDPFTFNLGGGLDVRLARHWLLRAEYRDWLLESPRETGFGATGLAHNQVPSLGLVYRF